MANQKSQVTSNDQKWANKSWKPFLWMAIGGTVLLIIGFVLVMVMPIIAASKPTEQEVTASVLALTTVSVILMTAGGLVTDGGIALMIVTMIKSNKAKAKLGMKK